MPFPLQQFSQAQAEMVRNLCLQAGPHFMLKRVSCIVELKLLSELFICQCIDIDIEFEYNQSSM